MTNFEDVTITSHALLLAGMSMGEAVETSVWAHESSHWTVLATAARDELRPMREDDLRAYLVGLGFHPDNYPGRSNAIEYGSRVAAVRQLQELAALTNKGVL